MAEKILVVDDDPDIVKFIEVTLTRAGFDVGVAFDGREALDKVSDWRPDLVLHIFLVKVLAHCLCFTSFFAADVSPSSSESVKSSKWANRDVFS